MRRISRSYVSAAEGEGAPPDDSIEITSLNEQAIQNWWQSYNVASNKWSALSANCSNIATWALLAGQPSALTQLWLEESLQHTGGIRQPSDVKDLADRIKNDETGSSFGSLLLSALGDLAGVTDQQMQDEN